MSIAFRSALIWLAGSVVSLTVALSMLPTSLVDGQYLPVGHDSFYHARRILDTVAHPGGFYEFDPKMHFPQGDWVTWPWGYDYLMAQATRGLMALTGSQSPMKVLAHLPPMFSIVGVALILGITSAVRLSPPLRFAAVLCFALSPQTQLLFGVGSVDHHWAEQLLALGMVLMGLHWLVRPESSFRAAALGVVLGVAVACQAGLFVLQLPVLFGIALLWLLGDAPPMRSAVAFAVSLVGATLFASLPSAPFRMGWFQLYYLSWFQLYIAICAGLFAAALCRWPYRPRVLAAFISLALVLLVPVLAQVLFSGAFLLGKLSAVRQIDEIRSPFALAMDGHRGLSRVALVYTLLVFVAPLTLAGCICSLIKERQREFVFFWTTCIFGLVFVLLQQRLHGFGSFALYVPWLVWAQRFGEEHVAQRTAAIVTICVALLVANAPSMRYQLTRDQPPAMDDRYASARPIFPVLAQVCRDHPGLVIADANDGHLIRYFTDCAVIGNNFRLTPLDVAKYEETEHLLTLPLDALLRERPETQYVLARITEPDLDNPLRRGLSRDQLVAYVQQSNPPLFTELMMSANPETVRAKPLLTVAAQFADTQIVEHVALIQTGGT